MIVVAAENALYGSTGHTKPKQFSNSSNTVIIPTPPPPPPHPIVITTVITIANC